MTSEFYSNNRARLFQILEDGAVVFLYSGITPVKSNDQNMHPFSVNRNFYYLTDIDTQNVWLVLAKSGGKNVEMLFIDEPNEDIIKWNGKMLTRAQASAKSGVPESGIFYMQDMDRKVSWYLYNGRSIAGGEPTAYFPFERLSGTAAPTPAELHARTLRGKYPALPIRNIAPMLISLRSVKTPEEIELIRCGGDVTIAALQQMLKSAKPGEWEYQWAADFEHYVARAGMRTAFTTIAAAGPNATMLHYSDNNCRANAGDLFLFDLGAECEYYSSDVSRTFPVNGRYTPRQREIYSIVRDAMDVARDTMRPSQPLAQSNQAVIDFYKKALRTIKLISDDSDVAKYYFHGVSHSIGLDTHDPCDRVLYEPGMVVSCEPGLYISEEGLGVRLENDILVTAGGPEDLIGDRLLDMDEIEAFMNG